MNSQQEIPPWAKAMAARVQARFEWAYCFYDAPADRLVFYSRRSGQAVAYWSRRNGVECPAHLPDGEWIGDEKEIAETLSCLG